MIDIKTYENPTKTVGECMSCGCQSKGNTIHKIIFSNDNGQSTSVRLCGDCTLAFSNYLNRVMDI